MILLTEEKLAQNVNLVVSINFSRCILDIIVSIRNCYFVKFDAIEIIVKNIWKN